ncbi:MAG: UPF0667 C1orf55 protein [Trebouxia sp. A1-2]|nr:MAG: UPF0667 C1orf55 protein [Trebouxia sp. A1-2]
MRLLTLIILLQDREPVCSKYWRVIYGGRLLTDDKSLQDYGIGTDSTLHLVGQLLGGKGGFGSLLRGAGRAILTDSVDACRDLSGRRLRQANAEKRLAEWAAEARERELEKVALKHVKEQQKATQKEARAQVDSEAVRREQQEALDRVSAAVIAAQEILAGGTLETGKRKAGLQAGDKPTKRARIYGFEDLSESDSDADSEYEAAARLARAGQVAATVSSGDDSEASAQEVALAVASAGPDAPSTSVAPVVSAPDTAQSSTDQLGSHVPQSASMVSADDWNEKPFSPLSAIDTRQFAPMPVQIAAPTEPHAAAASTKTLSAAPAEDSKPLAASGAATSDQAASSEAADEAAHLPIDLMQFSSASDLEGMGLVRLKNELQRHGLKCGGSLSERAARLFLLKTTPVSKLDQQHLSKPVKKKQSKQ